MKGKKIKKIVFLDELLGWILTAVSFCINNNTITLPRILEIKKKLYYLIKNNYFQK